MGVVKLEYVISYSSQDCIYRAVNLLHNPGSEKPWLCSPHDKSGRLEAEFQLHKASFIDFIDIGNCGSSTVEIQVGRSSFQSSTDYTSLLPGVTLLSLADIKEGVDRSAVYMFNKSNMIKSVAAEKWDRIKVICCQPYKKRQFGLSFLSLRTKESHSQLNIRDQPLFTQKNERPFSKYLAERSEGEGKSPPFSSLVSGLMSRGKQLLNASKAQNATTTRNRKHEPTSTFEEDAYIFLIACTGEDIENKSYEDYMSEFEEQKQQRLTSSEKLVFSSMYLEIFHTNTLTPEFQQNESSIDQSEISFIDYAVSPPCAPHSDGFTSEIKSVGLEKHLLESREKSDELHSSNSSSTDKPNFDIAANGHSKRKSDYLMDIEDINNKRFKVTDEYPTQSKIGFTRPEDFIQFDGIQPSTSSGVTLVDCPICGETFHPSEIERHAATCGELIESTEFSSDGHSSGTGLPEIIHIAPSVGSNLVNCPLCCELYPENEMSSHVDDCIEND